ncbi:hypothetical protein NIES3807_02450 [Microcystis aeruginosa NIES-3807]|uniref:Uncharacterized protein n=1 Tax=Microcystis aeruginosa NIES-3807 TaxID=2517785 RepID=A0AAD3G6Y7_MICAE|nr:hypothetical protein NIES3807_02450 [Microcystis aeruginosa NIES-3807]
MGFRQKAKVKREEKYVYLTSLGNAIDKIRSVSNQLLSPALGLKILTISLFICLHSSSYSEPFNPFAALGLFLG